MNAGIQEQLVDLQDYPWLISCARPRLDPRSRWLLLAQAHLEVQSPGRFCEVHLVSVFLSLLLLREDTPAFVRRELR